MTHLVLLGAGHAHLAVLRELARRTLRPRVSREFPKLTLVSPVTEQIYSGMVPGWLSGHYALPQCSIPLRPLAKAAGAEFRRARAVALTASSRRLRLDEGTEISYDLLSINIGSASRIDTIDGASTFGVPVKPLERLVERWHGFLDADMARRDVSIIGAGIAGVELACALRAAFNTHGEAAAQIRLFTGDHALLATHPSSLRRRVAEVLRARHIDVIPERVVAVSASSVVCRGGQSHASAFTVFASGAAAPPLFRNSDLALDAYGYARVDSTLRAQSHPEVFVSGDCASFDEVPVQRSGVYAVRQGAVLAHNLMALLDGGTLRQFVPQRHALALINTGAHHAIASWGPFSYQGRWAWWWKDRIDRRFVASARTPTG